MGAESSERNRRFSCSTDHRLPARIGIHDVLPAMAGRTVLPSRMEQETGCQRYTIVIEFPLLMKVRLNERP